MNNVVKYNTFLLNFIIIVLLSILIIVLGYKLWNKYIGKTLRIKFGISKKEDFSQVTLEKQVKLYDDYRNYIEGKDLLTKRCASNKRLLPYIVSPSCFNDKYISCMKEKALGEDDNSNTVNNNDYKILMHSNENLNGFESAYNNKFIDEDYYNEINSINSSNSSKDNQVNHRVMYDDGFQVSSRECQEQSYDMCLTDNFNFL